MNKKYTNLIFTLVILILPSYTSFFASASLTTNMKLSSSGSINYPSVSSVNVDLSKEIGNNALSLGFQLDGPDISPWSNNLYLRTYSKDANLVFVRFFEHRFGKPCTSWNEATKTGTWDWSKIDTLVRQIFANGEEPMIVLGFYSWTLNTISSAPNGMSTDPTTGLPKPDQWGAYCTAWVQHFKDVGLPVRYYEIINEPYHYFGWPATQPKLGYFMDLFHSAALGMRSVNPNIKLGNDASTMKTVLDAFISNGETLDFISFHRYGLQTLTDPDSQAITNAETLYMVDSSTFYAPDHAVQVYKNARGVTLPLINSEGNISDEETDPRAHTMLGGVYTALSIRTYILANVSYCVYYHMAGKNNTMGMIDTDTQKPYYAYFVNQMIGTSLSPGDKLYYSDSPSTDLRSLAWVHNGKTYILLILKAETSITFSLSGISGSYTYQKIDESIDWKNAAIQTGTYNGGNLFLSGYSVLLLTQASGSSSSSISTTAPTGVVVGSSFHDSATLTGVTGSAGGTVTYTLYSGASPSGTQVGSPSAVTVTNGVVPNSASFTASSAGSYYFVAVYGGDSNNNGVTGSAEAFTVDTAGNIIMTVSYNIIGGGLGYTAPIFHYIQGGVAMDYTLTSNEEAIQVDAGSSWSVTNNPLTGSNSTERWYSTQTLSGTASSDTFVFNFYHQYYVTVATNRGSITSPKPASNWYNSGSSITITVKPPILQFLYTFQGWSSTNTNIIIADATSKSTTATIGGAGTINSTWK
jgi:hypothetical protein